MADVAPIGGAQGVEQTATNAFGLGFEDLLRIVLTQLTYQDPLKPVENFEFVSQLAQFSQIQQTQTMSDRILGILQAQATNQATGVLGRVVDIPSGAGSSLAGSLQSRSQAASPASQSKRQTKKPLAAWRSQASHEYRR